MDAPAAIPVPCSLFPLNNAMLSRQHLIKSVFFLRQIRPEVLLRQRGQGAVLAQALEDVVDGGQQGAGILAVDEITLHDAYCTYLMVGILINNQSILYHIDFQKARLFLIFL